jgi:hypothetical protein
MCLPIMLAGAVVALVQCGGGKSTNPPPAKPKWTIIAYMDGNNNLDNSQNNTSYVISDIHEMEKVGSTEQVQVIAMLGCLKTGGLCKYYRIEPHTAEMPDQVSSPVLEDVGTKDMSDPATLQTFVKYCVDNYPAEHYMVIIDDHGGGWRGACSDEQNGAGGMMTLPEIEGALTYTGAPKLDLIVFHACLMSMVEVAYELRDAASYLAACQFTMPMESVLGSEEWLAGLVANPALTPYQLGQSIINSVYNAGQRKGKLTHMALTDLSKVTQLSANIATLGNHLITETGAYWDEVSHAWGSTHFTEYDDPAFVDLREFVKRVLQEPHLKVNPLISADANAVIDAVNAAVPYTKTNVAGLARGGLCIHFPYNSADFDSANYVRTAFRATNWHSFLSAFIQGMEALVEPTGSLAIASVPSGAAIRVDGTAVGQTPLTVQEVPVGTYTVSLALAGYQPWEQLVSVSANQTAQVSANLAPVVNQQAVVSGRVTWPGHYVSPNVVAWLDSSHTSQISVVATAPVNQATGAYTIAVTLQAPMDVYVEAWDDLDGNGYVGQGEGFGYFDANGNGQLDDMFTLSPGQVVNGANITLAAYYGVSVPRDSLVAYRR